MEQSDTTLLSTAPDLPYRPVDPQAYRPTIGLIGCGMISAAHLLAYHRAGYPVAALCDIDRSQAEARRVAFYPDAAVYVDYRDLLARPEIDVVDISTHPAVRVEMIEAALLAGKHVLSQKPFVLDLDAGRRLAALAERQGVVLAINQNGRWAPHFSYLRQAVQAGLIGDVFDVQMSVNWDHNGVVGTVFDEIRHLVLYDFAIHWFDMVVCLMQPQRAQQVFATVGEAPGQRAQPPLLAQTLVRYDHGQASLVFNANTLHGRHDRTVVVGTKGTLVSQGASLNDQIVTLHTADGTVSPELEGSWFPDGFHGAMAELLCAIEEGRAPTTNARDNLDSLALCFAAIASAESGQSVTPGEVPVLPGH